MDGRTRKQDEDSKPGHTEGGKPSWNFRHISEGKFPWTGQLVRHWRSCPVCLNLWNTHACVRKSGGNIVSKGRWNCDFINAIRKWTVIANSGLGKPSHPRNSPQYLSNFWVSGPLCSLWKHKLPFNSDTLKAFHAVWIPLDFFLQDSTDLGSFLHQS